jgi:hypothetical protein
MPVWFDGVHRRACGWSLERTVHSGDGPSEAPQRRTKNIQDRGQSKGPTKSQIAWWLPGWSGAVARIIPAEAVGQSAWASQSVLMWPRRCSNLEVREPPHSYQVVHVRVYFGRCLRRPACGDTLTETCSNWNQGRKPGYPESKYGPTSASAVEARWNIVTSTPDGTCNSAVLPTRWRTRTEPTLLTQGHWCSPESQSISGSTEWR